MTIANMQPIPNTSYYFRANDENSKFTASLLITPHTNLFCTLFSFVLCNIWKDTEIDHRSLTALLFVDPEKAAVRGGGLVSWYVHGAVAYPSVNLVKYPPIFGQNASQTTTYNNAFTEITLKFSKISRLWAMLTQHNGYSDFATKIIS